MSGNESDGDGGVSDDHGVAVVAAVEAIAERIEAERDYLTELDSAIGDADHGGNMARGWAAATEAARATSTIRTPRRSVRRSARRSWPRSAGRRAPCSAGSLVFASAELDDGLTAESAVAFAETYLNQGRGTRRRSVGDQTIVDALTPTVHTFKKSIETDDLPPLEALAKAVDAAERGVAFTVPIRARKGRASYLGWRSVGHQDPGATSVLYILEELLATAADALDAEIPTSTRPRRRFRTRRPRTTARRRRTTDGRARRRLPQRAGGRGIVEVAAEMAGTTRIEPVGGDGRGGIGTVPDAIEDAIDAADDGEGSSSSSIWVAP